MTKLNPFVRIDGGKCREAMNFYKDALGGELYFMTVEESPMANDMGPDKQNLIMHSSLSNNGWVLIASDMMRDKLVVGDNAGISLDFDNEAELRSTFDKLAQGGDVFMAPEASFWGAIFGMVTDKYGVEWMLNFQKEPMKK